MWASNFTVKWPVSTPNLIFFKILHAAYVWNSEKKNICGACKTFSTYGSRVVPHLSTRQAQRCLTSEFGWDLVFPPWYDRMSIRTNDTVCSVYLIRRITHTVQKKFIIAIRGFDPRTFGLWAQRATAAPNRYGYWYCLYMPLWYHSQYSL